MITTFLFGMIARIWMFVELGGYVYKTFFPTAPSNWFWISWTTLCLLMVAIAFILDLLIVILAFQYFLDA